MEERLTMLIKSIKDKKNPELIFVTLSLLILAQRLTDISNGYFFEKMSDLLLDDLCRVPIYRDNTFYAYIDHQSQFATDVLCARDPRFSPEFTYSMMTRFDITGLSTVESIQAVLLDGVRNKPQETVQVCKRLCEFFVAL